MAHPTLHLQTTVSELASLIGGEVVRGDQDSEITGFASLTDAATGDLSFLGNERYRSQVASTSATAVLIATELAEELVIEEGNGAVLIALANPSHGFAQVLEQYGPKPPAFTPGIHPDASVDPTAVVDAESVSVAAGAVIGARVVIGKGCDIRSGAVIAEDSVLGEDCLLHVNSTVRERCILGNRVILQSGCIVGSDGFGYEFVDGRHQKVEQIGIVQLDHDVEVGAGTTIDRARFGRTWIQEGTKIDNLVQIAHNVVIGKHCIIVAQVGIAGSATLGDGCVIAAQSGVAGHIEVCSGTTLAGRGGITKNITEPGTYMNFPAVPAAEGARHMVAARRVPKLAEKIRELGKRVGELEK